MSELGPPDPLPWQIHPSLKQLYLETLARLFRDVRFELSLLHEPSKGDSGWSFNCRCYSRQCHALSLAALGSCRSWLRVVEDQGLRYVFAIGQVPMRFYRGNPNKAYFHRTRIVGSEFDARQGVFEFMAKPDFKTLVPRLVIKSDPSGAVDKVVFVWLGKGGVPHFPYEISLADPAEAPQPIVKPQPTPDIPPAPLNFRKDRKKDEEIN